MKLTEIKRQNIIEAAVEEFREHGFHGANTTRIAKRAGVSSRTLYNHFESKDALFEAIAQIMIERNCVMAPVPYDADRDLKAQLVDALDQYVVVITDKETLGLNRMVNAELLRDLDRARAFYAELTTHDYPITQLIASAMEAGTMRKADPSYAASQLLGLVKTFFFWPVYLLGERQDTSGIMDDCVNMFLSHYAPDKDAAR
ncbi:TetR/AcrR family transcriptional regulator [Ruegeria arenilitoris]|uniref:TetR/AcrR family transcriptional regulator n=1 Tax=Ruegeria arenilitoris TaxID=1173585 RepID=UPI00147FE612|nr:TetR/AcrR family transcriptional regulator [Ruegeria arenilitoris]